MISDKFKFKRVVDYVRVTQKFGKNDHPIYKQIGLKGHNGLDIGVADNSNVYAPINFVVTSAGGRKLPNGQWDSGYGILVRGFTDIEIVDGFPTKLELVFAHLKKPLIRAGERVKAGQLIALSDNTGISTGPHLHFGVRPYIMKNDIWVLDYKNGYFGYVDPDPFFKNIEDLPEYPVDKRYNTKRTWISFLREQWVVYSFVKKVGKLPSYREINALAYGYWDLQFVTDPAMIQTWREITKPEYLKRLSEE